jgi:two-component system copper resistance phosphate regulon response regulator CusR
MRILIVDDDTSFRGYLRKGLEREGFAIDEAPDGKKAYQLIAETIYDMILLDIGIPEISGHAVLRELRQARNNALIFMITGQGDAESGMHAYSGGADDYLTKPIKLEVLIAKIRVWLKRRHEFLSSDVSSTILVVGDLQLDLLKRRAVRGGQIFPLTLKESAILEYLMRNKGKIKSQAMILQNISNVDFDGMSNSVEVHIKNLRSKIDHDFKVKLIKTIKGSGYMIDDESSDPNNL